MFRNNQIFVFTNNVKIHFVQVAFRRAIMIVIWTKIYMLKRVAIAGVNVFEKVKGK